MTPASPAAAQGVTDTVIHNFTTAATDGFYPATGLTVSGSVLYGTTSAGGAFEWHDAPVRQFVITLSGTLDFQTRTGEHFKLHPGDILLAEDTAGTGHSWKLVDDNPWRRAYVILSPGVKVPFVANSFTSSPS